MSFDRPHLSPRAKRLMLQVPGFSFCSERWILRDGGRAALELRLAGLSRHDRQGQDVLTQAGEQCLKSLRKGLR